jgi:hypothetical protein
MTEPILTLAWLVLAHLVADFVLQTGGVVAAKNARGSRALGGYLGHGAGVAACLVPLVLAFGGWGLVALGVIVVSHLFIDRVKIAATRRVEATALAESRRLHEGVPPPAGLGRAWTPLPAAWFVVDQLAHLGVIAIVWAVWLVGSAPTTGWVNAVASVTGGWDQAVLHDAVLAGVVLTSLVLANVRAGAILVATLVRPLEFGDELGAPVVASDETSDGPIESAGAGGTSPGVAAGRGWSIRIGPLSGRVVADRPPAAARSDNAEVFGERVALPPPARVGATIGVLERLLILTLILVGAEAAIGFVIAAKTLARFRQLDDRDFAEYYLLGTLASVSIAIVTGLIARAALSV